MQCVNEECGSLTTKVYESRSTPLMNYRRRICPVCKWTFVSVEVLEPEQKIPRKAARERKNKEPA